MRVSLNWTRVIAIQEHHEYCTVMLDGGHAIAIYEDYDVVLGKWRKAIFELPQPSSAAAESLSGVKASRPSVESATRLDQG